MSIRVVCALAFATLLLPVTAIAQPASPQPSPSPSTTAAPSPQATPAATLGHDRIDTMWKTGPQEAWFSASFLSAVPFSAIAPILDHVKAALGTYDATAGSGSSYVSTFSSGTQEVRIHFDAAGKIDGLFLPPPKPAAS